MGHVKLILYNCQCLKRTELSTFGWLFVLFCFFQVTKQITPKNNKSVQGVQVSMCTRTFRRVLSEKHHENREKSLYSSSPGWDVECVHPTSLSTSHSLRANLITSRAMNFGGPGLAYPAVLKATEPADDKCCVSVCKLSNLKRPPTEKHPEHCFVFFLLKLSKSTRAA